MKCFRESMAQGSADYQTKPTKLKWFICHIHGPIDWVLTISVNMLSAVFSLITTVLEMNITLIPMVV